jgi:hypothetical protein
MSKLTMAFDFVGHELFQEVQGFNYTNIDKDGGVFVSE